jgi:hypothetical protein
VFDDNIKPIFKECVIPILRECTIYPSIVVMDKSVSWKKANSPSVNTTEMDLVKADRFVKLYRYGSNLVPFFISLDDEVRYNNVYWVKQYDKGVDTAMSQTTPDNISEYIKYTAKKFSPVYPSIGYFPIKYTKVNYEDYYFDVYDQEHPELIYDYQKEKEWYKNNSLIYLPNEFSYTLKGVETGHEVTKAEIIKGIKSQIQQTDFIKADTVAAYIISLYSIIYKTEYVSNTDITKQNITIEFKLK